MSNIRDILLRVTTHAVLDTKGSNLTNVEMDDNIIALYEWMAYTLIPRNYNDYDPTKEYDENDYSVEDNILYISLQDTNQGNLPSSSPSYWEEVEISDLVDLIYERKKGNEVLNLSDSTIYDISDMAIKIPSTKRNAGRFYLKLDLYDNSENYPIDYVVYSDGTHGGEAKKCYKSLANGNIGNDLDDATKWAFADYSYGNEGYLPVATFMDTENTLPDHDSTFEEYGNAGNFYIKFIASNPNTATEGQILLDVNTDVSIYKYGYLTLQKAGLICRKSNAGLLI